MPRTPPPPPLPPLESLPTTQRINQRFRMDPSGHAWPADGTLPEAGLLVHCFDGREDPDAPWRPALGAQNHGSSDLSTSLVYRGQLTDSAGRRRFGSHSWLEVSDFLFGHGCGQSGGLIFRNSQVRAVHRPGCPHAHVLLPCNTNVHAHG